MNNFLTNIWRVNWRFSIWRRERTRLGSLETNLKNYGCTSYKQYTLQCFNKELLCLCKFFIGIRVRMYFVFFWNITSVPLKKIVTCICHWLIVPLLWILWQILISYCKFIMPKALKWGILHICTLVIYQDIP